MNRKILLIVLALAVVLLATPYVGMAHATRPTPVSGDIELVSAFPLSMEPVGKSDNQIWIMALTEHWTGGIDAVGTTEATWMWHKFGGSEIILNIHEKLSFQATMILGDGKSGTFTLELNIEAPNGHWTILSGTGDLANLRGHGELSLATQPYSYTGEVHFDP